MPGGRGTLPPGLCPSPKPWGEPPSHPVTGARGTWSQAVGSAPRGLLSNQPLVQKPDSELPVPPPCSVYLGCLSTEWERCLCFSLSPKTFRDPRATGPAGEPSPRVSSPDCGTSLTLLGLGVLVANFSCPQRVPEEERVDAPDESVAGGAVARSPSAVSPWASVPEAPAGVHLGVRSGEAPGGGGGCICAARPQSGSSPGLEPRETTTYQRTVIREQIGFCSFVSSCFFLVLFCFCEYLWDGNCRSAGWCRSWPGSLPTEPWVAPEGDRPENHRGYIVRTRNGRGTSCWERVGDRRRGTGKGMGAGVGD